METPPPPMKERWQFFKGKNTEPPPAPMKNKNQVYDHETNTWTLKRKYSEI